LLFVGAFGVWGAMAQLPTATILGTIMDGTGAVVPGAMMTARNVETGQTRTTTSGADGAYRFTALPVGADPLEQLPARRSFYGNAGRILSTATFSRQIQLALKILF
jgi:hypothetical protein